MVASAIDPPPGLCQRQRCVPAALDLIMTYLGLTYLGGRDGWERVSAAFTDRRCAGSGWLAVHVPVLHAFPAGGRQAVLVLQLHALPRADAGLRHDHRRGSLQRDRG